MRNNLKRKANGDDHENTHDRILKPRPPKKRKRPPTCPEELIEVDSDSENQRPPPAASTSITQLGNKITSSERHPTIPPHLCNNKSLTFPSAFATTVTIPAPVTTDPTALVAVASNTAVPSSINHPSIIFYLTPPRSRPHLLLCPPWCLGSPSHHVRRPHQQ